MTEREVFEAALEAKPAERDAFLDRACAGAPALRQRVMALLARQEQAGSFLEGADLDGTTGDEDCPPGESPLAQEPSQVLAGRYHLLEQIGEGGMGTVWLALQTEPVRRQVAVKLIKAGMDSRMVLSRFEAERQALALMDHPNIAKVLDGGTTDQGRPFFVMEYVKGIPLTRYCDDARLSVAERLELFIAVCQAVQHAHQKGVIHRDLKPSNLLIYLHDGKPVPKVIDFGLAKAMHQPLTEHSLHTAPGLMLGTPLYMSPEQAAVNNLDVDTRSDIYSLGVVLYELLTGTTPLEKEQLRQAAWPEVLRLIQETELPKPSTRLCMLGQAAATVAERRQSDPRRLSQLLRGELDWILLKALDKDRSRRYETPSALAADVQRYLHDEPVAACPPSAWYRLRKFARRHRARLTMAAVVTAALTVAAAAAWWSDRQQVALAAKVAADEARQRAETERSMTASLAEAETLLAQGDKEIDYPDRWHATVRLAALAVERAERLRAAGEVTEELAARQGQIRAALAVAEQDCQLRLALDRLQVQEALLLNFNFANLSRVKAGYADALKAYGVDPASPQEAAARVRASRFREELLAALDNWGRVSGWINAPETELLKQALAAAEPAPDAFRTRWLAAVRRRDEAAMLELATAPELHQLPRVAVTNVALDLCHQKLFAAAERVLRPAQERFPRDYWLNTHLGLVLLWQRKYDEALPYMTAALAVRDDFPGAHYNLGVVISRKGHQDEAIRQFKVALQMDERNLPALCNLGVALKLKGNLQDSIDAFQTALRIDPKYLPAHHGLGNALEAKDDLAGAIRCYEAALQIDPEWAVAHCDLGIALKAKKDLKGAIKHFAAATKSDPSDADAHYNLGNALEAKGDLDGAKTSYEAALEINPYYADVHNNLGTVFVKTGHPTEAIRCFEAALKIDSRREDTHYNMGLVYYAQGDLDAAIRWYNAALSLDPKVAKIHNNLGIALADKGDLEGATRCYQAALKIDPQYGLAYINQGHVLALKKDLKHAVRAYQDGLKLEPRHGWGHAKLGQALMQQGRFVEAIEETALALKFLPPGSRYAAGAKGQLQWCQKVAPLAAKLPAILRREEQLQDAVQTARCAWLCQQPYHQLNLAAAQFYVKAFSDDAKLADHLGEQHRYNAACAAIRASTGQGKDAAQLTDDDRSRWAKQALAWLQADLTAYAKLVQTGHPMNLAGVQQRLQHWRKDDDLVAVRDAAAVGRLPAEERQAWAALWAEVDKMLRATEKKGT